MKQAMVFAAGLGTRLRPLTDTKPKALVEVAGKPLLLHILEKLKASGYERIVVNVHHFAEQIISYLHANDNFGIDISVSDESSMLLDTGGGLKKASSLFSQDEPVLIHNVDILSNADLNAFDAMFANTNQQMPLDALLLVSQRQTKRYFVFGSTINHKPSTLNLYPLIGWRNTETGEYHPASLPSPSINYKFAFSGIHIIHPRLFEVMQNYPERFSITDFYIKECSRAHVYGYLHPHLELTDVGKLETLAAITHTPHAKNHHP